MRSTVGRESTTFGFSILVTVGFGMVQTVQGSPGEVEVVAYAVGAAMSFALLEGVLSRGFRRPMPQHHTQTQALGTSLNVVSVLAGLAVNWLVGSTISGVLGWGLAPLLGALVYLVVESLEAAVAERLLSASGDPEADEVEN